MMLRPLLAILLLALPVMLEASEIATGQWHQETIATMPTQMYVPATKPQLTHQRALMVSLGGCGQQAAGNTEFRDQSNWQTTADGYGMVVAIPNAPGGGVLDYGCWDYYGTDHNRNNRHAAPLLNLVSELLGRPELNIDPRQVYISGLSSGGGMVNVLLCLAPDVFAGGGNAAGPALGTSALQTTQVATNVTTVVEQCQGLAGDKQHEFASQIVSLVWGSEDRIAHPGYAEVTALAWAKLYDAEVSSEQKSVAGKALSASQTTWADDHGARVELLIIKGLSHAWPAGGGSGASPFMDNTSINYPALLTQFLFTNNRRVPH